MPHPVTGYTFLPENWNLMKAFELYLKQEDQWMTPSIQLEGNLYMSKIKKESNDEPEPDLGIYVFGQPLTKDVIAVDSSSDEERDEEEMEEEEEETEAQEEHQNDTTANREEEEKEKKTVKENEIMDNKMNHNSEKAALFGEIFQYEEMTDGDVQNTPSGTKRLHSGATSNAPKRKQKKQYQWMLKLLF